VIGCPLFPSLTLIKASTWWLHEYADLLDADFNGATREVIIQDKEDRFERNEVPNAKVQMQVD
jgi:hypothetical protein